MAAHMTRLFGAAAFLVPASATFCQSMLFTNQIACEDGNPVDATSGCCASTGKCPSSCMSWGSGWSSQGPTCNCNDCSYMPKIQLSVDDRYLHATNYFRCRHGHPPLQWDATVASHAQTWANTCPIQSGTAHSDSYNNDPSSGENVAAGQKTPEKAVEAWYNEVTDPGYTPGTTGSGTGHYTALIWKATTKLGCGQACPNGNMPPSHVCQYASQPPNFGFTQAYLDNVPQSNTPTATEDQCCQQIYGNLGNSNAASTTSAAAATNAATTAAATTTVAGTSAAATTGTGTTDAVTTATTVTTMLATTTDLGSTSAKPCIDGYGGCGGGGGNGGTGSHKTPKTGQGFCHSTLYYDYYACEDGSKTLSNGCCATTNKCPTSCMAWGTGTDSAGNRVCNCNDCDYAARIQLSVEDRYLKAHNYFRCLHGQPYLTWDATVASHAQTWANTCPIQSGTAHSDSYNNNPSSGENVAAGQKSPEKAVTDWYNEIHDPGYTAGGTSGGAGHYTALIWKSTTKLGCGQACPTGQMAPVHVCQYADSPPNFGAASAYVQNVPQDSTPTGFTTACCEHIYGPAPPPSPSSSDAPTPSPSTGPAPAPAGATLSSTNTTLKTLAKKGTRVLDVVSTIGFSIGDWVKFGSSQTLFEEALIVAFGSIILDRDLTADHGANIVVHKLDVPTTTTLSGLEDSSSAMDRYSRCSFFVGIAFAMVSFWISGWRL